MLVKVEKRVFEDENGRKVNYDALLCKGVISDLPFEIALKPADDSKFCKKFLVDNCSSHEYDVQVESFEYKGQVMKRAFVQVGTTKINFKLGKTDIYLIELYNKLCTKK